MPRDEVSTVELDPDGRAAGLARRFVDEHGHLSDGALDDAQLVVSELVANAVVHGAPRITLTVRAHPPGVVLEVHDEGDAVPSGSGGRPDDAQSTGRGLQIVAALSDQWGITPSAVPPGGKTVWCELGGAV